MVFSICAVSASVRVSCLRRDRNSLMFLKRSSNWLSVFWACCSRSLSLSLRALKAWVVMVATISAMRRVSRVAPARAIVGLSSVLSSR